MDNNIRNDIAALLIENFGKKPFTVAMLRKNLGDALSGKRLAYKIALELEKTGYVTRTKVTGKDGKLVLAWAVNDADEENALNLFELYPSE